MTPRMNENLLKMLFFIAVFVALVIKSLLTSAQPLFP